MTVAAQFEIEYLQYLKPDGTLAGRLPPAVQDPTQLVPLFKRMLFVRTFDSKAIALQRTGKLGTYAASLGHEATHVGIGASMSPDDVFAPSYREYGAQFMRGVKPRDVLMYWGGDERGNDFEGPRNDYPWCVPISTQMLMAAGAALSFKLRKQDQDERDEHETLLDVYLRAMDAPVPAPRSSAAIRPSTTIWAGCGTFPRRCPSSGGSASIPPIPIPTSCAPHGRRWLTTSRRRGPILGWARSPAPCRRASRRPPSSAASTGSAC